MRRSLRIVAFALLGLALLYLVPVNILLNTGLGPHLLSPYPDRFHADWSRAYSVWPGRVSATEVVIGGHSGRTIWRAEAATLSLVIDPAALLARELLVRRADVAALAVEVDRSDVDLPPRVPRSADGWTLIFDRINADSVALLRFDDLTLTGRGSADGGFRKQLRGGSFELFGAVVGLSQASLSKGGTSLFDDAKLLFESRMGEAVLGELDWSGRLQQLDAKLTLDGAVPGIALDPETRQPRVLKGGRLGTLHAELGLDDGALQAGGVLRVETLLVEQAGAADTADDRQGGLAILDLQLSDRARLDLTLPAWLIAIGAGGHLAIGWDGLQLGLEFPTQDDGSLLLDSSTLREADIELADTRFRIQLFDNIAIGNARLLGRFEPVAGSERSRLRLELPEFRMAPLDRPDEDFLNGSGLVLALETDLGTPQGAIDGLGMDLAFADAEVPDISAFDDYLDDRDLGIRSGSGRMGLGFRYDAASGQADGEIDIGVRSAVLDVGGLQLRGDLDLAGRIASTDLGQRQFAIDGSTLNLDRIAYSSSGGDEGRDWKGTLALRRGDVTLRKPLQLHAHAHLAMDDAGPLLALFATRREFPRWIARLIGQRDIEASGDVAVNADGAVVDRLVASDGRFDVLGRLRLGGGKPDGQLYLRWGVLATGLDIEAGERDFKLIKPREWYDEQPDLLPRLPEQ